MAKRDRWNKALVASIVVHCFVLAGAGWWGSSLLAASPRQNIVEVELVSDPGRIENNDRLSAAIPLAAAASRVVSRTIPSVKPVAVAEKTAATVAERASYSATTNTASSNAASLSNASGNEAAAAPVNVPSPPRKIVAPRILAKIEPQYPEDARRAGIEGTVAVRIEIKDNGQTGKISVVRSAGLASLDMAAIQAIEHWQFIPAQDAESGRAVSCYTTISVVFRLQQ
jgi:periplasmic protein TonB